MSHTNQTTNYSLPQFITTDKPAWLTDINNAFSDIDTAIKNAADDASQASTDAGQAITDAGNAQTTANAADAKGGGAVASIADAFDSTAIYDVGDRVMYNSLFYECTVAVITPGPWTGATNWARITVEQLIDAVNNDITAATTYGIGDYISLRYKSYAGLITNSKKRIQFYVDSSKIILNTVTGCNISGSTFRIYGPAGDEQVSISDGTFSYVVRNDGVQVTIDLTNALQNDDGVVIYFNPATSITFT